MDRTASEILDEFRIDGVDPSKKGRQYTTCPACSSSRTGFNRKSKCLAVNIDNEGVRFFCNHCPDMRKGRLFSDARRPNPGGYQPVPGGAGIRAMPKAPQRSGYDALHRTARAKWRS